MTSISNISIIIIICLLISLSPSYSTPTSPKSSEEDDNSTPPQPLPPRPFGVEVKGEVKGDKGDGDDINEAKGGGPGGGGKDDTEGAKAHKAFVPHPHIQPPKNPSPTSPLHLPPTGYELSAIIIVQEDGNSAFADSSTPHHFPYVTSSGPRPLSTRDLRPSKTYLSHSAMGSSGDWSKSFSGAHGGGDLVICLSSCSVTVSGGDGDRDRTFPRGSSLLFRDYYGAGHRIYSREEPLQILTIELKRDCVGEDCGEGWGNEGNSGNMTTSEIIKERVRSFQTPSKIDVLGYVAGGSLAFLGSYFYMKVLPVYVVMIGMGCGFVMGGANLGRVASREAEKMYIKVKEAKVRERLTLQARDGGEGGSEGERKMKVEMAAEMAAKKAARDGGEEGGGEMGENEKNKQEAADYEAAASGGAE
ncbi:hypothetical protein TrCOL_g5135 [Triparma columacea]|uniref:Uncharacterized protein n=1 Tax=Triparma columacea TaxID=722753 RepID=A0A9W7GA05_9STRA|nr:hypothetical protein TrCOL_g5135 [Triparma columacea]